MGQAIRLPTPQPFRESSWQAVCVHTRRPGEVPAARNGDSPVRTAPRSREGGGPEAPACPRLSRSLEKDAIIWFRPLVMEPAINRLEPVSGMIAPTRDEL